MRRENTNLSWLIASVVSILTCGGLSGCVSWRPSSPARATYPILQGVTGSEWTRLNLLREKEDHPEIHFFDSQGKEIPASQIRTTSHEFPDSTAVIDEYQLTGLKPEESYLMKVKNGNQVVDERRFSLLQPKPELNFAVVSCSDDSFRAEQQSMWRSVVTQKPDFILAIGDNAYADREEEKPQRMSSPRTLWKRYVETRQNLAIFREPVLIPMIAVWDDHDFGMNNGDRRYPYRSESLQIFRSFFPQSDSFGNFEIGPAAASKFIVGEQQFLLLDNRSFRSPNRVGPACLQKKDSKLCRSVLEDLGPDPAARIEPETHFGKQQTRWALDQLLKGAGVSWMISGDQWFGGYSPFESFEGNHPIDFRHFLKSIRQIPEARVAFLSGDRHSSELARVPRSKLGFESVEIVSSPIHARVYPTNWDEFPNPDQVAGVAEAFNYTMVRSQTRTGAWKVHARNFRWDKKRKEVVLGYDVESLIDR